MRAVRLLESSAPDFGRAFARLRAVAAGDQARVEKAAREIVEVVRERGDRALLAYTERFDGVRLRSADLRVPEEAMRAAESSLPRAVRSALRLAAARIRAFHRKQIQSSWQFRDRLGLILGQRITPLSRVGIYVPGGHAAYPSSVLMNAIPARVAGVDEIVMVSPAGADGYNPAVLAAARIAGVSALYRVGGAQAVAALAFGTRTLPRVEKIVGPGNAYVQAAKRLVYGQVDIDSIAGPSEVLVIADGKANPAFAAADLLAQAEHGSGDECAILLTPSRRVAEAVQRQIAVQLERLPRRAQIAHVLAKRSALIIVRDLDEAVELAEQIAPEHLELLVEHPRRLAVRLRNAGAVFEGAYAPAALGDYLAGPNHVLPTGGSARFFSPLGVYHFVKRTSTVCATPRALRTLAPAVRTLANLEGYEAHAAAVSIRFAAPRRRPAAKRARRR
jgi:histidinol dehydrogenase